MKFQQIIARVLSITDISVSPNGLDYIEMDKYIESPKLNNQALDIAYPMYNKETRILLDNCKLSNDCIRD